MTEVVAVTVTEKWGEEDFQKRERTTGGSPDSVYKNAAQISGWFLNHAKGRLANNKTSELNWCLRDSFPLSQTKLIAC